MALLISKRFGVAGVAQLAGVDDVVQVSPTAGGPAPWIPTPGVTPPERLYGLGNARGFCCQAWNINWPALNMSGWADVDKAPPASGHMLCSHLQDGDKGHGAVIQDAKSYGPSWTYMLTRAATVGESGSTRRTTEACKCTPDCPLD
jgi:hypothetical protein